MYFLNLHMGVYVRIKSQVSSTILTSFRQGGWYFTPPPPHTHTHTHAPQNELLKSPPKLGLNDLFSVLKGKNLEKKKDLCNVANDLLC